MRMKKHPQFLISKRPRRSPWVGITIGIDLGDIWSHYCTLNEDGEVIDRGRFTEFLRPIAHKTVAQQETLTLIRARDVLVRLRTSAVNSVRGLAKPCGYRLPASTRSVLPSDALVCSHQAWLKRSALCSTKLLT